MDSGAYRQLAEAYIAARRPPARRPHSHLHASGSDLVCDSSSTSSPVSLPLCPMESSFISGYKVIIALAFLRFSRAMMAAEHEVASLVYLQFPLIIITVMLFCFKK